jgi:hypothetical protein
MDVREACAKPSPTVRRPRGSLRDVFAAILDRYPGAEPVSGRSAGTAAIRRRLGAVLRDQFEAGMGMLGDGIVHDASTGAVAAEAAVAAWQAADEIARSLAARSNAAVEPPLVKACLLGPWSAALRGGESLNEVARRIHEAIGGLFEAGAPVVQLVEDDLVEVPQMDDTAAGRAHDALSAAISGHIGHVSLSVGGGNVDHLGGPFFFDLPAASYAFDLISGPENWRLIVEAPADRGVLCGVADCRGPGADEEAVMIWAALYAASTQGRGLARVGLCPSVGLGELPRDAARRKLDGLASASRKSGLPPDELATLIDPRAVDARTAGLGTSRPRPVRLPGASPGRGERHP